MSKEIKNIQKLTEEKIKEYLEDIIYSKPDPKQDIVIWCWGYEDNKGNFRCGFMEQFDKAMKEHVKNYKLDYGNLDKSNL